MLLTIAEVVALTRVRRATIYRLIGAKKFPAPKKIGSRSVWRQADVARWASRLR